MLSVGEISLSVLGSKLILFLNVLCSLYLAASNYHQDSIYPGIFLYLHY